jgi:hypothetical protein
VVEQEQDLWDKDEVVDCRLDCELKALKTHESKLNSREATLVDERKCDRTPSEMRGPSSKIRIG